MRNFARILSMLVISFTLVLHPHGSFSAEKKPIPSPQKEKKVETSAKSSKNIPIPPTLKGFPGLTPFFDRLSVFQSPPKEKVRPVRDRLKEISKKLEAAVAAMDAAEQTYRAARAAYVAALEGLDVEDTDGYAECRGGCLDAYQSALEHEVRSCFWERCIIHLCLGSALNDADVGACKEGFAEMRDACLHTCDGIFSSVVTAIIEGLENQAEAALDDFFEKKLEVERLAAAFLALIWGS